MAGIIQTAAQNNKPEARQQASVNTMLSAILDGEKVRKRFDELLGERTPQFIGSIVSLVNSTPDLQLALRDAPMTVVQAALKAATFDLPIEPSLGYAYIVPFKRNINVNGEWIQKTEAVFVPGYKGLTQLCLRTGAYSRIPDAVDVREGELLHYDRLTGDCEFAWEEDDEKREQLPIIGYAGYFRLKNGAEKTIYMTVKQIESHERKNRKGKNMTRLAKEDFDSYARKTVIRRLASKYGLMSIQYRDGDSSTVKMANEIMDGDFSSEDDQVNDAIAADFTVDEDTGEVTENGSAE